MPNGLVRRTLDHADWVRVLAGALLLSQCLSSPRCINGHRQNNAGIALRWTSIPSRGEGGVEKLLVASCYRNWDNFGTDGPLGLNADVACLPFYLKTCGKIGILCFYSVLFYNCMDIGSQRQRQTLGCQTM